MADNTLPKPMSPGLPTQPSVAPVANSPYVGQGQRVAPLVSAAPASPTVSATAASATIPTPTAAWKPSTLPPAQPSTSPVLPSAMPTSTPSPVPPVSAVAPMKTAPVSGMGFKPTPTPTPTPMPMSATPSVPNSASVKPSLTPAAPVTAPKPASPSPLGMPSATGPTAMAGGLAAKAAPGKPPMSPGAGTPPPPKPIEPRKSVFRFLPFVLLGALVVGLIGFAAYWFLIKNKSTTGPTSTGNTTKQKKTITYWGLWEPTNVMEQVIADFEKANPEYDIQYVQQSHKEYRERLQAAIAQGTGPDVFRFHESWVPMLRNELSPLPEKIMSKQEFSQTFYPVAEKNLTLNNNIVGVPLMIDGLGLYYNKDIFTVANKTPPKTWEEMKQVASELTIKSGNKITRGGVAMGTASNVEHFSEILALLMLQNGADPADPTSTQAIEAITFYTDFAQKLKVWDTTLPNATVAFAKGDVAMMIAPSWRAHEIKAQNPNLQFDVVPVPQLADKERTTWASFWAEGVSAQSKEKEAAWKFVKFLSSADVQKKFYSEATKVRAFGEIYSRKDISDELASKEYVGAFIQDAPFAKTWYMNAYTHDNGINDLIIKYYLDAINKGGDVDVKTVKLGTDQVLNQFSVSTGVVPVENLPPGGITGS